MHKRCWHRIYHLIGLGRLARCSNAITIDFLQAPTVTYPRIRAQLQRSASALYGVLSCCNLGFQCSTFHYGIAYPVSARASFICCPNSAVLCSYCVRCSAGAPGVVNTAAQGGQMQEPKVGKCKSDCSVGCSTFLLHRAVTPPQGRLRISTLAKNWPFTPTLMLLGCTKPCTKPCTARPAEAAARCFLVKAASPVHHLVAVWARARSSTGGPDGRHDCPGGGHVAGGVMHTLARGERCRRYSCKPRSPNWQCGIDVQPSPMWHVYGGGLATEWTHAARILSAHERGAR